MYTARKLARIVLTDDEEQPRRLEELWEDQPIVLVFLRHFG